MKDWVAELASQAGAVVAIGDCACWGGIPATEPFANSAAAPGPRRHKYTASPLKNANCVCARSQNQQHKHELTNKTIDILLTKHNKKSHINEDTIYKTTHYTNITTKPNNTPPIKIL
jgi:Ni,Fe-hydrogenase I small subunit